MHFLDACSDPRRIETADGGSTTVYSYKPADDMGPVLSGIGPATVGLFEYEMAKFGHAILVADGSRPWNHRIIGVGIGHDDAEFAESGRSMADYYESGRAFAGHWWDKPGQAAEHFSLPA